MRTRCQEHPHLTNRNKEFVNETPFILVLTIPAKLPSIAQTNKNSNMYFLLAEAKDVFRLSFSQRILKDMNNSNVRSQINKFQPNTYKTD